jgi:two-component system response regulator RegA
VTKGNLLLVDDDPLFCRVLGRSLAQREYEVHTAATSREAAQLIEEQDFDYVVVDLRLGNESGLNLVPVLRARIPEARILVLTGYASIATAIEAIKLGATHYLAKPADADEVIAALHRDAPQSDLPVTEAPMSIDRLAWEHVQKVLSECNGNISEAARRLNMHRRTLQRKLQKYPPRQ